MSDQRHKAAGGWRRRAAIWLRTAQGKSIRITSIYLILGCAWIVLSDLFAKDVATDTQGIWAISLLKGLFYVAATAVLIHFLIYPTLKKTMESKETILSMNRELERSNLMYKGLSEEYKNRQALLESLINSIPDQIFYKDTQFRYLGCNTAFATFFGRSEEEFVGKRDEDFFKADEARLFLNGDEEILRLNTSSRYEEAIDCADGERLYFETLKTPYFDAGGNVIGLIGVSRDVTVRRRREEQILYLSTHDVMTGLNNRAHLTEELKRLDQREFMPLSVIMADINGLKLINDSLGHEKGDRVIKRAAGILRNCLRPGDVVARTGGDEFTVLLPKTDAAAVQAIVESIRAACRNSPDGSEETQYTNLSLGWATKRDASEPLDKMRKTAEDAMYRHKIFEQRSLHSSILSSIKKTMLEKSDETEAHAERLARLSERLGRALGLPDEDLVALELLSTLHDIGKISVDKNILTKTDHLSETDWQEIKQHPEVGFRITQASPDLIHISDYILSHHERWDGGGYPRGLAGTQIPLLARILSVVDAFDAMTQNRSYRSAMSVEEALSEIEKNAGLQFDPKIAGAFLEMLKTPDPGAPANF